jgi:putative transcriptional regulator
MNKTITTGKRSLKGDVWHDDNGPIAGYPDQWDLPMTDAEINEAALSDPDNQPRTPDQLAGTRRFRVARAKYIRQKLGLSQEDFAARFRIPLGTLRDWEQHRTEPDQAAQAYLQVIEHAPDTVQQALQRQAA